MRALDSDRQRFVAYTSPELPARRFWFRREFLLWKPGGKKPAASVAECRPCGVRGKPPSKGRDSGIPVESARQPGCWESWRGPRLHYRGQSVCGQGADKHAACYLSDHVWSTASCSGPGTGRQTGTHRAAGPTRTLTLTDRSSHALEEAPGPAEDAPGSPPMAPGSCRGPCSAILVPPSLGSAQH